MCAMLLARIARCCLVSHKSRAFVRLSQFGQEGAVSSRKCTPEVAVREGLNGDPKADGRTGHKQKHLLAPSSRLRSRWCREQQGCRFFCGQGAIQLVTLKALTSELHKQVSLAFGLYALNNDTQSEVACQRDDGANDRRPSWFRVDSTLISRTKD